MTLAVSKSDFEAAVLWRLYQEANGTGHPKSAHDVAKMFSVQLPRKRIDLALQALRSSSLISATSRNTWILYSITNSGLDYVEKRVLSPTSFLRRYRDQGDVILFESEPTVPASDRLVTLSHNQPDVIEATESLKELSRIIRESNNVEPLTSDERDEALRELHFVEQVIALDSVRLDWAEPLIKGTLVWIGRKAAENVIGALALSLLTLMAAIFGFQS